MSFSTLYYHDSQPEYQYNITICIRSRGGSRNFREGFPYHRQWSSNFTATFDGITISFYHPLDLEKFYGQLVKNFEMKGFLGTRETPLKLPLRSLLRRYVYYNNYIYKYSSEGFQTAAGTSTIPIIAGSVGGAVVIFIILLLCVTILCLRQSHKKNQQHTLDNNKMITELSSSADMTTNPSYSITKHNIKQEDQYDNVLQSKSSLQEKDTIKMDTNPSYGRVPVNNAADYDVTEVTEPDHDVTIETNPSYGSVLKNTKKMSEDEDENGYVETNVNNTQTAGYLKIIGPTSKEEESVYDVATDDVNINPNPSYSIK